MFAGIGIVGGLLLLAGGLSLGLLVWRVDRAGRTDTASRGDVIVVLGARVEANGAAGPDLASRVLHAVELWRAGQAPYLICTGGFKGERLSAAAVCRRLAIQQGVPAERIWLGDGTTNTAEDAQAAAQLMAVHGWRTAIVVSHPLHIFRTLWLFRRAGVSAVAIPTFTGVDDIAPSLRLWYTAREVGAIVATVLEEWGWLPANWRMQFQNVSHALP